MSGGHFDYNQYRFAEIAEEIKSIVKNNKKKDWYNYSDKTLEKFKKGIELIEKAEIYAQRIDWLVSGDDGEDSFHERLAEDLLKLMPKINEMDEDLEEIQMPIGNFIMSNAKGVMCDDGVYYHYAQVCRLLRMYYEEKTKEQNEISRREI